MTNEQVARIEREYQDRRREAHFARERMEEELFERCPAIRDCSEKRRRLSLEKARAMLRGDREAVSSLETAIRLQSLRKKDLLCELGLPEDYPQPPYHCSLCCDTGYVKGEKCRCYSQLVMELFYHDSPLWEAAGRENFARSDLKLFDDTEPLEILNGGTVRSNMRLNINRAKKYADEFRENRKSLLMMGPTGTGKTFLCNCIADALIRQGFSVLYMTAGEFFDAAEQQAYGRGGEAPRTDIWEAVDAADLLILDDLGIEKKGSFPQSAMFRLVNDRLLKGQATVLSTNLTFNELAERYMERVSSRIAGSYKVLKFFGEDLRQKKRSLDLSADGKKAEEKTGDGKMSLRQKRF